MKNWKEIVQSCHLQNWREALAAVLTYARPDEFSALCSKDTLQTGCHLFHLTTKLHFAMVAFVPVNYCNSLLASMGNSLLTLLQSRRVTSGLLCSQYVPSFFWAEEPRHLRAAVSWNHLYSAQLLASCHFQVNNGDDVASVSAKGPVF